MRMKIPDFVDGIVEHKFMFVHEPIVLLIFVNIRGTSSSKIYDDLHTKFKI